MHARVLLVVARCRKERTSRRRVVHALKNKTSMIVFDTIGGLLAATLQKIGSASGPARFGVGKAGSNAGLDREREGVTCS